MAYTDGNVEAETIGGGQLTFEAAGFFFFAATAVARVFFFGSGALSLPLLAGAVTASVGLVSTDVFGFLGTVLRG